MRGGRPKAENVENAVREIVRGGIANCRRGRNAVTVLGHGVATEALSRRIIVAIPTLAITVTALVALLSRTASDMKAIKVAEGAVSAKRAISTPTTEGRCMAYVVGLTSRLATLAHCTTSTVTVQR